MKHAYYDLETSAVINLFWVEGEDVATISSVGVHRDKRGNGYASALMKKVLRDADQEKVTLYLDVDAQEPETGMNEKELCAWYVRCGFREVEDDECFYIRQPRKG